MFRFENEYSQQDMEVLNRVSGKIYRRKKVLLYRGICGLLGVGYLAFGGWSVSVGSWPLGLLMLAVGALFSAVSLFYYQGAAWRSKRMMLSNLGTLVTQLREDGVFGRSDVGEELYPYSSITGLFHCRGRYLLFLDAKHAVLLPEKALVEGELSGLRGFLEEKTGKTVVEIK